MKNYLFIAMAALSLAACAEKMDDDKIPHKGEVTESYISISLSSSDADTRAADGTYQKGEELERAVETAYFFFFDAEGNAFPVNVTDGAGDAPGGEKNHLPAVINPTNGSDMNNVSDIKNVVLLLKNYQGTYPASIVAVLNWVPVNNTYTLENLKDELADVRNSSMGGKFIMSNAVYATSGTPASAIYATPLTADNIFTDEANAKANPVTIYVERAAAKVTVTTTGGTTKFDVEKPVTIGSTSTKVYAKVLGWELYNDYQNSTVLKNIDPAWNNDALGFTWNDSPWFRSYWADSQTTAFTDNTFQWKYAAIGEGHKTEYGYGIGVAADVTDGTYADKTYTYCGENTNRPEADRTKIILKAQLQEEDGDPVELARWYTTEYLGEGDLKTAVANTLKYTLYFKDGDDYVGLKPEHIKCVAPEYDSDGNIINGAPAGIKPYQVFFQLSPEGEAKDWYKKEAGAFVHVAADIAVDANSTKATNKHLATVEPAIIYNDGQTYYYIDVKHLGNSGKDAEYGIVRNHIYSININKISGYGSPVYVPIGNIVTPEYPGIGGGDDEYSFVAAEVRILSWRMVQQGVNVQP